MTEVDVTLHGYQFSVYAWIARFSLHEKGVAYDWVEVDPFADEVSASYLMLNPFKVVPTLKVDDFVLYETNAITRFIDEAYDGPALQQKAPRDRARVNQILSIVDQYAYWPMVRQVFSHGCFLPRAGEEAHAKEIAGGLVTSRRVLSALEQIAGDTAFLAGDNLTLADIHLAPLFGYFCEVREGADMVAEFPRLSAWWAHVSARSAFVTTRPDLTALG